MPNFVVRCGIMRTLHVMQGRQEYLRGMRVIARTPRGLEAGEIVCEADQRVLDQMDNPPGGTLQRPMTEEDENELAHLTAQSVAEADMCFRAMRELNLPMDLVDIERVFGGERAVVYYLSENRVDFRELVKRLSNELQTRVEMRQIGVRDEAKLLADYGDCGKPVCCNTHLMKMPPVSMKMAKMQKATLDPNKISGRCGRLKCCLRYEYDVYEEHQRSLPRIGADIVTSNGRGRVLGQEILSRQLLVQMEDNRRVMVHADDILSVISRDRTPDRSAQLAEEE
ncbi:MAG: regulatory iron-sulfur-containing complex subunit RicT [Aureliella sp.]